MYCLIPDVAKYYNNNMGVVDKHDMLRQSYDINRKSMKWWRIIFFGVLDMAMVNSYILQYTLSKHKLLCLTFEGNWPKVFLLLEEFKRFWGLQNEEKLHTLYQHQ